MAQTRRSICLQLVEGKRDHDKVYNFLNDKSKNKQQILVEAVLLYMEIGGNPRNDPPPSDPPPQPFDPEGLQETLLGGFRDVCERLEAIGPAVGMVVSEALKGGGFSVNQSAPKKPKRTFGEAPVRQTAAEREAMLENIGAGLGDWMNQ